MDSQGRSPLNASGEKVSRRENKLVASPDDLICLWNFSDEKFTLQLCTARSFSTITPMEEKMFALLVHILVKSSKA